MKNKLALGAGAALFATALGIGPIIIGQQAEKQLQAHQVKIAEKNLALSESILSAIH